MPTWREATRSTSPPSARRRRCLPTRTHPPRQGWLYVSETEAPKKETVSITVDGRPVEARPNELVIAAAQRHGVYIPRFCYHERMAPVGMCRQCLVEVDTGRGPALQVSCMVPVAEKMAGTTKSEKVRKAQECVLEFMLINHPLNCPVCEKG